MKFDQDKPDGLNFYWDGLQKLVQPFQKHIIADYNNFAENPTLENLKILWDGILFERVNQSHIEQLMHIYNYGAKLYGDKNYLGLDIQRIIVAMKRHLIEWLTGISIDEKSGYSHFSHVLANILIAAELL